MALAITPILSALGPNPGDGICVFFYDPAYDIFPAAGGSALGYTNFKGEAGLNIPTDGTATREVNGIRGAYVGVGFDIKGNFSNTTNNKTGTVVNIASGQTTGGGTHTNEGGTGIYTLPGGVVTNTTLLSTCRVDTISPNVICTRAGEMSGYQILSTTQNLSDFPITPSSDLNLSPPITLHQYVTSRDDVVFHRVKVTLKNNIKQLRVDIQNPTDGEYYPYQILDLDYSDERRPPALKVGVAFATSSSVVNCEIKNFAVYGNIVDYSKTYLEPLTSTNMKVTLWDPTAVPGDDDYHSLCS